MMHLKKIFLLLVLLMLSPTQTLLAEPWILTPGVYEGVGHMEDESLNQRCSYDIRLVAQELQPDELHVVRTITYHDPIMCDYQAQSFFIVRHVRSQVYNILINNYSADHGFCSFDFCMHHLSYSNGSKITEGIHKYEDNYIFSGMGTYRFGLTKTWTATLVKQP